MSTTVQQQNLSKFSLWLLAIRPKTLPAAVGPVAVGSSVAYAEQGFRLLPALACFLGAMLLQIAVNLANDYFDYKNKIDSEARLGPVRVTQSGLISPGQVKGGMTVCLVLAGLIFLYLASVGGVPIVAVGIASVLAALAYSGGPYPLASHGLGELFVFIFFGLVAVCATGYIQTGRLSLLALLASFPPGLLITAIMVVNNLRDITTDKKAGKNTLAVRLGPYNTIIGYKVLVYVAYLVPVLMLVMKISSPFVLMPLCTLPLARALTLRVECDLAMELNDLLASTARLSLVYSLLFSAGLIFNF